jgi:hypothetical protein
MKMLCAKPKPTIAERRAEPPYDIKIRGMPVIGMIPIVIPTLTKK